MASAFVEMCCAVFASDEYFWFSPANSRVRCSTSRSAVSTGEMFATWVSMTSERRRTVGKYSSVVRYVFSIQTSSVPSRAVLGAGLE